MSWISENYEKAALGVGALAAIGLAFIGYQKLNSVAEEFSSEPIGSGSNDPSVKSSDVVATAKSSFQLKREWVKGEDDGRAIDLFTGVPLFVNKNDLTTPVDLNGKGVAPVHAPIPNSWWIDNRIDPGFGDSLQRDEDEDGFVNLAEFEAKTDPNDKRSYPPLITKLSFTGDEAIEWVLRPGFEADGGFTFEYSDTKGNNARAGAANIIKPGEMFFAEGAVKNRFKLIGSEKVKEVNEKINVELEITMVEIEDQRTNKKGQIYKIPAAFRKAEAAKYSKFDRTAIFSLEALGLDGEEFKVEENTEFALPPTAASKAYKVIAITKENVTVEVKDKDGKIESFEISKGSTGPRTP